MVLPRCGPQATTTAVAVLLLVVGLAATAAAPSGMQPECSDAVAVFQTAHGDVHFCFYPDVAPVTVEHIFKLVTLGAYTGNHFFRVDKGFVAQIADVAGGRSITLSPEQQAEADRKVPLEVKEGVKHETGVVSMGRYADPNSGASSFSFLLGPAPHLDMQYTIFGRLIRGMETLRALEGLETRREGIFVMPKERVTILSSHWYLRSQPLTVAMLGGISRDAPRGVAAAATSDCASLAAELDGLRSRFDWAAQELERVRAKCLPGGT